MKPLVSVILPTYNARKTIEETIASVVAQRDVPYEVIVVDDGSDDGTVDLVKRLRSQTSIRLLCQKHAGPAVSRNFGAGNARGEYLAFIDHDDLWEPTKLKACIAALQIERQATLAYTNFRRIGADGTVLTESEIPLGTFPSGRCFRTLLFSDGATIITPSQVVVRKAAFDAAGGFAEELRNIGGHYEDWMLWLKLSLAGPFVFLPEVLTAYRRHGAADSIGSHADYARLIGRLAIFDRLAATVANERDAGLSAAFREKYFGAAITLGYFARDRGEYRRAADAYLAALRIKPFSFHAAIRLTTCRLLDFRKDGVRKRT